MTIKRLMAVVATGLLIGFSSSASAECESVDGRIVSSQVTVFSDGSACPSSLGLCTEGRFTGDLEGTFRFIATTLVPFAVNDPGAPADVVATTGVIELDTEDFCDGTLKLQDSSAFSLGPDGFFAGLQTVVNTTGDCAEVMSGRNRTEGVFMEGCVDCTYKGEICFADDDDDSDSDSD